MRLIYMKNLMFRNILAVAVILLFLGVTVQPTIAKEETQEYTLIVPSFFGIKQQKITLTSEQSDRLDYIFLVLHEQLKTVGSIEETKILFNRTIDILYENHLLSRFEVFLTKKLLFSNIVEMFYSALDKRLCIDSDIENKNCWIAGVTTYSDFIKAKMYNRRKDIAHLVYFIKKSSSKVFFADISFGYKREWDVGSKKYFSNGWISTIDINGFQDLTGTFRGGLSSIWTTGIADYYTFYYGTRLFLGIGFNGENDYFLGRAALVDVYEKPDD